MSCMIFYRYEWVGWKNETSDDQPVEIVYEFGSVRNFTELKIHSNNLFSKGVTVFRAARLYFSVGGKYFNGGKCFLRISCFPI